MCAHADESHFGRFTNQYTAGEYYFDVRVPDAACLRSSAGTTAAPA